jgi:small-conductance mechanosensitive channel
MNLKEILSYTLVEAGSVQLSVWRLVLVVVLWLGIGFVLRLIKRGIYSSRHFDLAKKFAIYQLVRYLLYVVVSVMSLQVIGLNVSVILAGSAALLVGFGLGVQNVFSDFVSGIILLMDSSVKVHDVVEIGGMVCRVKKINLRTTTVVARDNRQIIVPNSEFTRSRLVNWTHSETSSRFQIEVHVSYGTDVRAVQGLLKEVALSHKQVLKSPEPLVRLQQFNESHILIVLLFWTREIFRVENVQSELRVRVYEVFSKHGIKIPFPQQDVHVHINRLDGQTDAGMPTV